MAAEMKQVLIIGLSHVPSGEQKVNEEEILASVTEEVEKARKGYKLVPLMVDPSPHASTEAVRQALHSRKWDCVTIGFEVRGNKILTPVFESLVNMVFESRQATKMAFPLSPSVVLDAIERVM